MESPRSFSIKLKPIPENPLQTSGSPETAEAACQTDSRHYLQSLSEKAEKEWEQHLNTTTRMKFEQLKEKYQNEISRLLKHIRDEKAFRETECRTMFK